MPYQKLEREFEINENNLLPSGLSIATTIFLPEGSPEPTVLFLFPGAGYSRAYFDIQFGEAGGYSQADFHARQRMIVVTVDHLGVGDSSLTGYEDFPVEKPIDLSLDMMASACDAVVRIVVKKLQDGTLDSKFAPLKKPILIGVGQSMGGKIVTIAQANHATFDAIALLGSSVTQTRLTLLPGRRYPPRNCSPETLLISIAQDTDMRTCFHWPDEPAELVEADMAPDSSAPWRSKAVPACSIELIKPAIVAKEAAAVRVPVLLVYGEIDVTADPLADVAMFRSTADISLLIVPEMAHMHNFAPTRSMLWIRLNHFANQVALTQA